MMILLKNFSRTNGSSSTDALNESNSEILQSQMQNIVKTYNNSFLSSKQTFNSLISNDPSREILQSRAKKRKQPQHEQIRRRMARSSTSSIPKCSFCSQTGHKITNCPAMSHLLLQYTEVKNYDKFLEFLCDKVPILHPDPKIQVSTNILNKLNHVIVHREIYSKFKKQLYQTLKMNEMIFTVSILSKDTGSILKDKVHINGSELESYIHRTKNISSRQLFDGTKHSGMYEENFNQRNIILENQNLSQQVIFLSQQSQQKGVDPPVDNLGQYSM